MKPLTLRASKVAELREKAKTRLGNRARLSLTVRSPVPLTRLIQSAWSRPAWGRRAPFKDAASLRFAAAADDAGATVGGSRSRYRARADRPKDRKERYANRDRALMFPNVLMRWGLKSLTRVAWSALPIVLMLEAVPAHAFAQSPVCHAIRRGESATQAARRVTGNGQNAYQEWFQIMNPSSRFVPKSQYNRIRLGWRACVITPAIIFERTSRRRARGCRRIRSSQRLPCSRRTGGARRHSRTRTPAMDRARRLRRRSKTRGCRSQDAVALRGDGCALVRVADGRRLSHSQEDGVPHRAVLCPSIR